MHLKNVVIKKGIVRKLLMITMELAPSHHKHGACHRYDGKPHAAVDVQFEARVVQVVRNSGRDVRFDRGVARFF